MSQVAKRPAKKTPRKRPSGSSRSKSVEWSPMPLLEAYLYSQGVKVEVCQVSFDEIDFDQSRSVQSRLTFVLNQEFVDEIARGIDDGIPVFRPVLYKPASSTKYVVWDGQHRLAACQLLGINTCEAYIARLEGVEDRSALEALIPRRLNNLANGQRPGPQMTRVSIIYAHERFGLSPREISHIYGVPDSSVYNLLAAVRCRKEISAQTGLDLSGLADASCVALSKLRTNARVLAAATAVAVKYGMSIQQIKDMVSSVMDAPTESRKLETIQRVSKMMSSMGEGPGRLRRRTVPFVRALRKLTGMLESRSDLSLYALDVPDELKDEVLAMADAAIDYLSVLTGRKRAARRSEKKRSPKRSRGSK